MKSIANTNRMQRNLRPISTMREIVETLAAAMMIYGCNTIFLYDATKSVRSPLPLTLLLVLICIFLRFIEKGSRFTLIKKSTITRLVIFMSLFLCCMIIDSGKHRSTATICIGITTAMFLIYLSDKECTISISKKIVTICSVVCAYSLLLWLLISLLHILSTNTNFYSTWAVFSSVDRAFRVVPSFYNIYFETQEISFFGIGLVRNTMIFAEAPMCSYAIVVALLLNEYIVKSDGRIVRGLLTCGVISTISTTGIISLMLILGFKAYQTAEMRHRRGIIALLILLPLLSLGIQVLISQKISTSSGSLRIDDIDSCIRAFRSNPLTGTGLANPASIVPFISSTRVSVQGISSGLLRILAQGGLLFAAPLYICLFNRIRTSYKYRDISMLAFIVNFIWLLLNTSVNYLLLSWFMIVLIVLYNSQIEKVS